MKDLENKIEEIDDKVNPVPRMLAQNIQGMFQTVSVAPTGVPLTMQNQIQIYVNGATHRLYVYDSTTGWIYVVLS